MLTLMEWTYWQNLSPQCKSLTDGCCDTFSTSPADWFWTAHRHLQHSRTRLPSCVPCRWKRLQAMIFWDYTYLPCSCLDLAGSPGWESCMLPRQLMPDLPPPTTPPCAISSLGSIAVMSTSKSARTATYLCLFLTVIRCGYYDNLL